MCFPVGGTWWSARGICGEGVWVGRAAILDKSRGEVVMFRCRVRGRVVFRCSGSGEGLWWCEIDDMMPTRMANGLTLAHRWSMADVLASVPGLEMK